MGYSYLFPFYSTLQSIYVHWNMVLDRISYNKNNVYDGDWKNWEYQTLYKIFIFTLFYLRLFEHFGH